MINLGLLDYFSCLPMFLQSGKHFAVLRCSSPPFRSPKKQVKAQKGFLIYPHQFLGKKRLPPLRLFPPPGASRAAASWRKSEPWLDPPGFYMSTGLDASNKTYVAPKKAAKPRTFLLLGDPNKVGSFHPQKRQRGPPAAPERRSRNASKSCSAAWYRNSRQRAWPRRT